MLGKTKNFITPSKFSHMLDSFRAPGLEHWLSKFIIHQNHLGCLLKCRFQGPGRRDSEEELRMAQGAHLNALRSTKLRSGLLPQRNLSALPKCGKLKRLKCPDDLRDPSWGSASAFWDRGPWDHDTGHCGSDCVRLAASSRCDLCPVSWCSLRLAVDPKLRHNCMPHGDVVDGTGDEEYCRWFMVQNELPLIMNHPEIPQETKSNYMLFPSHNRKV